MTGWQFHPKVRSGGELTLGERAADRMRNSMGSWAFVFGALLFLAVWMVINVARVVSFDKYPFILLNLVLSCLAAMQGAILLIAAKRSDQISSELAQHDYDADVRSKELLETMSADFASVKADFAAMRAEHAAQGQQLAALMPVRAAKNRGGS
jgi:uncharacterized membrane protein